MGKELDLKRFIAQEYCKMGEYERGLNLYKEIFRKEERADDIKKFIEFSSKYSSKFTETKNWLKVLDIYSEFLRFKNIPKQTYKNIGLCLSVLNNGEGAMQFFKLYEKLAPEDKSIFLFMGETAFDKLGDYFTAIEYYEKALEAGNRDFTVYNTLGHLYSKCYRDSQKQKQIDYFTKAVELAPNNEIVVKNLAYVYGKFGEVKKADEMYKRMLKLNPPYSDLHSYGAYLVRTGRFREGFKYLRNRFWKEDIAAGAFSSILKYKDKMWKINSSLKDKKVLLHYEQGFGDSIMFIRFLDDLKTKCKSVELVLQKGLVKLFKDSGIDVPIRTLEEVDSLDFDVLIPMMDLPLVYRLKRTSIPYAEGYLDVPEEKIKNYRRGVIKNNGKFRVGFAYEGSAASLETKRDIPIEEFYELMKIENIDMYCFQVGDIYSQLDKVPKECKFIKLGETFNNWQDTACAMKCMDVMITSDNGVMNLAGALGVKTFGIFNSFTEWRWIKTKGNDVAWYKSVKPFQCATTNEWYSAMHPAIEEIKKLAELKKNNKC